MFDVGDRDRVRERILEMASSDPRVVGGAVVGSFALDEGDRWSDLDLTFAVADDVAVSEVLEGWSRILTKEFGAIQLFDLPRESIIYRVFLLPDCLEIDLSFAPASAFGARGPNFKLLFGESFEHAGEPTDSEELFGYAVHHVLHARTAIERSRYWLAEYWISAVRHYALELACLSRGLDGSYGRDFDRLPTDVLEPMNGALVRSLERDQLDLALRSAVDGLLRESDEIGEMARRLEPPLRELSSGHVP